MRITLRNTFVFIIMALVIIFVNTLIAGFFDMTLSIKTWTVMFWVLVFPIQVMATMILLELPKLLKLYSSN